MSAVSKEPRDIIQHHADLIGTFELEAIATLTPATSTTDIRGSKIGVGFETLDREMFTPNRVYPHLACLGAKHARVQTGWNRCETQQGVFDFNWLDDIVDSLLEIGVQPIFCVSYGNQLYMTDLPPNSAVGGVPLYYGEDVIAAWQRYVAALVGHFRSRIKYWEVWNEPNIKVFWFDRPISGKDYAELVRITALQIRSYAPEAKIVGGALSQADTAFLEEALDAGMAEHLDVVSFHPYQAVPEHNLSSMYQAVSSLLRQYAPNRRIQIWQDENGFPSQTTGHNDQWLKVYDVDEVIQAKWVARRILSDLATGFDRTFYFHTTDLMERPYVQAGGEERPPVLMGLLHGRTYKPKVSFDVMRRLCTLFDNRSKSHDILIKFADAEPRNLTTSDLMSSPRAITFVRDGRPLIAYWLSEDPQHRCPIRSIEVKMWWDSRLVLERPVLADLLTGIVYALPPERDYSASKMLKSPLVLPLADYPLIITDASILDISPMPNEGLER